MIEISCKFKLQNLHYIYKLRQFSWDNYQPPKVSSNMQRIAHSSSFILYKNYRELLTSEVVFAVNSYKCFIEKKK